MPGPQAERARKRKKGEEETKKLVEEMDAANSWREFDEQAAGLSKQEATKKSLDLAYDDVLSEVQSLRNSLSIAMASP